VPKDNLCGEWRPSSEDNSVRALDSYREMAQRHGIRWRESDFRNGEIIIPTNGTHAARLAGVASEFFRDLFDLDYGSLTRDEFLHRYPFARPSGSPVTSA